MLTAVGQLNADLFAVSEVDLWTDLEAWKHGFIELTTESDEPMRNGVAGGFRSDRLAFAIASGYQAALRALGCGIAGHDIAALCVTEANGAHPKQIATVLKDGRMSGEKRYTSLLPLASTLIVIAKRGALPDGRPALCAVKTPVDAPGVQRERMASTPFCPELPHGITRFQDVAVPASWILDGDGYTGVVKPFRTLEDLHVSAAVAAFLIRQGLLHRWPHTIIERLSAVIAALDGLSHGDCHSPAAHITLGGAMSHLHALVRELTPLWNGADEADAQRWHRDAPVLSLLSKVRERRRQRAWDEVPVLRSGGPSSRV